jgi:uncharacterized repeat protein (TIGR03803 family)
MQEGREIYMLGKRFRTTIHHAVIGMSLLTVIAALSADAQFNGTVLHTFTASPDGAFPGPIIRDAHGNIFGTTYSGGLASCGEGTCGTIFRIDPAGNESVVFAFSGGSQGDNPIATLAEDSAGNLLGTTEGDGFFGLSVAYEVNTSRQETILAPNAPTGGELDSPLLVGANGNIYGMTPYGGDDSCGNNNFGCGELFSITPSDEFTMLHAFTGPDGIRPEGGLVEDANGNLYGAAFAGGDENCKTIGFQYPNDPNNRETGCGTVFELGADGTFSVLHTFSGKTDGSGPLGLIIDSEGNLYGIAQNGGIHQGNGSTYGLGTIFKLATTTGTFSTLFEFTPRIYQDQRYVGQLVRDMEGNLYGIQQLGGANNTGCLFRINPSGEYTNLFDFDVEIDGKNEDGFMALGLALGSHGDFYTSMTNGGSTGLGTVFHITP